ncbi:uncharacterized protein LOC142665959 [Rhinoderma darwinii]|uniref:uncharacterized protein LOC142665959 n=1 Tax=Rhinoderma darwinii TaxID=43563 RepID=UPI003F66BF2A
MVLLLSPGRHPGAMPRSSDLPAELRQQVVEAHEAGKGYKTISKVFELHHSTVRKIVYKCKAFSTIASRPRSGRPTKLTAILRRVRRSGAGNQNGKITRNGGGGASGEETAHNSGRHPGAMPRSKEISEELRKKVVEAHKSGKGYKTISKVFELHRSTVRQIIYKWKVFNTIETRPRSGRPTKLAAILRKVRRSGAGNQNGKITRNGGEETAHNSGTDTRPDTAHLSEHAGVEDDVPASEDPAVTRTKTKRIRGRKKQRKDVELIHNRAPASPATQSSSPVPGPAEHRIEVILCCEICGACFPTETELESHQTQHLDTTPHECEDCGKAFQSAAGLKTHKKRKHGY